eukprot:6810546-Pyramimonas_sp.AAC.1
MGDVSVRIGEDDDCVGHRHEKSSRSAADRSGGGANPHNENDDVVRQLKEQLVNLNADAAGPLLQRICPRCWDSRPGSQA